MTDLANRDQALRLIWEQVVKDQPREFHIEAAIIEYGRRVLALAESKEELAKALGEE
jgi:hypothetical protein